VAWSPDGQYLASQGSNSSITIWDSNSYTILRSLSDVEVGAPLVWNSDSLQVAGGNNGTTKIWNAITGQLIKTLPAEGIYMDSLDWQSNVLVNANALGDNYGNSQIYVWDVASGQTLQIIERPSVFTVALNPDGTRLAYGGEGGNVEVIDTPLLSNKPPFANAGPMQIVTASNGEFAQVILDGSGSYDSDGTILDYSWYENDVLIAEGVSPEVTLGLGDHLVTLEVVDNNGANGSDTVTVLVTE
jgi:WD40 repeat protein